MSLDENAEIDHSESAPENELTEEINATEGAENTSVEETQGDAEPDNDAKEKNSGSAQERINKITAKMYAEKRRSAALEEELAKLQTSSKAKRPTLEDHDFDEAKFQDALIDYKIESRVGVAEKQQASNDVHKNFASNVERFTKKAGDYMEVIAELPELPSQTLEVVMSSDNGPELAYYLGKNLDIADEIANASPMVAAMKLGEISVGLKAVKKDVIVSSAPDPIKPINSGGGISSDKGPDGAIYE